MQVGLERGVAGVSCAFIAYNSCVSGDFQFKSERAWDAAVTSKFGELFSLDADLLADGLATIPLYQKLDLPVSLFSVSFKPSVNMF
jgi:hypothetical protein